MTPRSGPGGLGSGPRGPKTTPRAPQEATRSATAWLSASHQGRGFQLFGYTHRLVLRIIVLRIILVSRFRSRDMYCFAFRSSIT